MKKDGKKLNKINKLLQNQTLKDPPFDNNSLKRPLDGLLSIQNMMTHGERKRKKKKRRRKKHTTSSAQKYQEMISLAIKRTIWVIFEGIVNKIQKLSTLQVVWINPLTIG